VSPSRREKKKVDMMVRYHVVYFGAMRGDRENDDDQLATQFFFQLIHNN